MIIKSAIVVYYFPYYMVAKSDPDEVTLAYLENRGTEQFLEIEKDGLLYYADVKKNWDQLPNRDDKLDTLNLLPLEMFPKEEFIKWDKHATYYEANETGWTVSDKNYMSGNRYRQIAKDILIYKKGYNGAKLARRIFVSIGGLLHHVRYNPRRSGIIVVNGGVTMTRRNSAVGILQLPDGVTTEVMALINEPESITTSHISFRVQDLEQFTLVHGNKLAGFVFLGNLIPEAAMAIDMIVGRVTIDLAMAGLETILKRFAGYLAPNTYYKKEGADPYSPEVIREALRKSSTFLVYFTAEARKDFLLPINQRECLNKFRLSTKIRYPMLDNNKTFVDFTRDVHPYHVENTFAHPESTEIENARVPVYSWLLCFR